MAKSPQEAEKSMVANLAEKTGKSLDAWLKIVAAKKPSKHGEIVTMLKSEHDLTHGYANLVAHRYLNAQQPAVSEDDLVETQYAGAKQALRPIYEALLAAITRFGSDVEVAPKKANVSLRRNKQFALLQPSTATRLDVGIQLKGVPAGKRLEASGSFSAMVTHRVRVSQVADVDKELIGWLKQAYDAA